jgi:hypothetical protein
MSKCKNLVQSTNSYGTFSGDVGHLPITTTTVSSYPYVLSSQTPTIIVLGGCPACKVYMIFYIPRMTFCSIFRLACWKLILHF